MNPRSTRHAFVSCLICSVLLLASGACASGRPGGTAVEAGNATLRVENDLLENVSVWVVRDETPIRVGSVDSHSVRVFELNRAITGGLGDLSLRAETRSASRRLLSQHFTLGAGQTIEWTLREGVAAASTLLVRNDWW